MRWAIAISFVLHLMALTLVFRSPKSGENKYPTAMIVHLSLPPVAKGVQNPAVQKASEAVPPKPVKQLKNAPPANEIRTTDINDKKKPKRKQEEPPPQKKEDIRTEEANENKSRGLPEGVNLGSEFGSARLDASGFDSPYYLNVLFGKIRNLWENPFEGPDKIECTIYFVVSRDGHVVDSAIETSSGIPAYDQAALRAVLGAKPPPLPNQFELDELGIHLVFQYIPGQ
jgi:TonB family protein